VKSLIAFVGIVTLPLALSSCAAVEFATAKNDDERENVAMGVGINPVIAITGANALEGPSMQEREKKLPEYIRTIRNRNLGKSNSGDRRLTLLAMEYSYPILSARTEKEVVALLGTPDERIEENGHTGLIYRINGIEGGRSPVLFINPD
jgi:hypothetical protein